VPPPIPRTPLFKSNVTAAAAMLVKMLFTLDVDKEQLLKAWS
jgi:hypothetical protein